MKRTRRSFLRAALGCSVAALGVPGALLSVTPKPELTYTSWYKPGIWALPKPIDGKLLEGSVIVSETIDRVYVKMKNHVHLKADNKIREDEPWQEWKGVHSSKPFLER